MPFITARKQSLRKGNIFTGMCLSTGGGWWCATYPPGTTYPRTTYPPGLRTPWDYIPSRLRTPWTTYPPRTTYPPDYVPPPPWTVYVRAVRILLECILVFLCSCFQNNVEIHINHIQSGLTQMGNLSAFASTMTSANGHVTDFLT